MSNNIIFVTENTKHESADEICDLQRGDRMIYFRTWYVMFYVKIS